MLEKSISLAAQKTKGKISQISKQPYLIQIMESVVIMSDINSTDKDLLAAESLLRLYEYSCITFDEIETEFNTRIKNMVQAAAVSDDKLMKKLPLKIKMLILAQKLEDIRSISREYNTYREELWNRLPEKDPKILAKYYYNLSEVFLEFEEYDAFSEFNNLVARLFVKYR